MSKGFKENFREISEKDARATFNKIQLDVLEYELHSVENSDNRGDQVFTYKFLIDDSELIWCYMYWDDRLVYELSI